MATTNIELDIENITGVADADDQFVKTAQKYVVSSIPQDLLLWAGTSTAAATHGGDDSPTAVTLPQPTDSIIDVQRNGFSAIQVSESMQAFLEPTFSVSGNSITSLHKPTETNPKYYLQAGNKVVVKPDPTASETVLVNYVDFLKIDDDCDLRGAVIYHASASEFTKLASDLVPSWSSPVLPIAPVSPDFGSDLTISSSAPAKPIIIKASVDTSGWTEPAYTKPSIVLSPAPTISNLSISAVSPTSPSAPSFTAPDISSIFNPASSPPSYVAPILALSSAPTISNLSISSVTPTAPSGPSFTTPAISSITVDSTLISNIGTPPTYTAPVVGGATEEITTTMDADSAGYGTDTDFLNFSKWFSVAGDLIEDEEDTELAQVQLQKISAYIQAYSGAMQNQLNVFNDANAEYQGKLQEAIQQAQINAQKAQAQAQIDATETQQEASLLLQQENQEYAASLQKFGAEVQQYQANVASEVQEYQQNLAGDLQVWQAERTTDLQKYGSDIQNALNTFNKENVEYQAQLQQAIQEVGLVLQKENQEYVAKLQKFGAEVQNYQADVAKEVQEYQQNLAGDIQVWQGERTTDLQKYGADIQNEQAEFNKELQIYQAAVQASIQDAQLDSAEDAQNIQKYGAELQSYQGEVAEQTAEKATIQQNIAYYAQQSDKYYQWAQAEVTQYIQNNSKMINKTMAAQAAQQRR